MEHEKDHTLSFLDVLMKRQKEYLEFTFYRKKTYTGCYLQFESDYSMSHRASVTTILLLEQVASAHQRRTEKMKSKQS